MGADDRVAAQEVRRLVEEVHRAALTVAEPVAAPEQLGHDPTRVGALRQTVAVLAVRRDRVVVGAQHGRRADGHRLLADIQVEEAADLAERVALRSLLLEATDQHHLRQELPR